MQSKPTVTLRRTGPNSAAVEYKPQPKEIFEEVRAQVEHPEHIISLADPEREIFLYVEVPAHWSKGALLNVRNRGDYYVITLYPEEEDPRHPERAMRFANTWTCQDFVSKWYSRETHDPRAR